MRCCGTSAIRIRRRSMGTSRCKGAGRRGRGAGGFLAAALLLLACHRETPHYNLLLITLDTFRADRVGALTPNLAKLAREGVVFTNADSPVPLTLPAHSSLLSGVLPPQHGLRNNGAGAFPADRETLATLLSRKEWRTGAFVSSFVLDRRFG